MVEVFVYTTTRGKAKEKGYIIAKGGKGRGDNKTAIYRCSKGFPVLL
jgi:hypothetical protein